MGFQRMGTYLPPPLLHSRSTKHSTIRSVLVLVLALPWAHAQSMQAFIFSYEVYIFYIRLVRCRRGFLRSRYREIMNLGKTYYLSYALIFLRTFQTISISAFSFPLLYPPPKIIKNMTQQRERISAFVVCCAHI